MMRRKERREPLLEQKERREHKHLEEKYRMLLEHMVTKHWKGGKDKAVRFWNVQNKLFFKL